MAAQIKASGTREKLQEISHFPPLQPKMNAPSQSQQSILKLCRPRVGSEPPSVVINWDLGYQDAAFRSTFEHEVLQERQSKIDDPPGIRKLPQIPARRICQIPALKIWQIAAMQVQVQVQDMAQTCGNLARILAILAYLHSCRILHTCIPAVAYQPHK
ncbi:hypothetical protein RhiLY_11347 [Ceratobasidium sp. AG-Ba]|nr:hypothetical protein RhiLY_04919 [Ceratobasidium sp. AG-Ba]QRW12348.1 hypothetical protein RhiLY_11347 [Ceratobasidium sp. AG-Ba]